MKRILQTTNRDIRMTATRLNSGYRSPQRKPEEFVQTIADRYSKCQIRLSTVNLTFRQSQPGVEMHSTTRQTHLHVQPRLSLIFNSTNVKGGDWNTERSVMTERILDVVMRPIVRHRISEVMIERIINRQVRENSLALPAKTVHAANATDSQQHEMIAAAPWRSKQISDATDELVVINRESAKPIERVLRQAPKQTIVETSNQMKQTEPEQINRIVESLKPSLSKQAAQTRAHLTDVDLTRITDQVLKTIDKRIVAARERVGRN